MFMKLLGAAAALAMLAAVPATARDHDRNDGGHGYHNDRGHGWQNGRGDRRGYNNHRRGRYYHNGRYYHSRYRHHNQWLYR